MEKNVSLIAITLFMLFIGILIAVEFGISMIIIGIIVVLAMVLALAGAVIKAGDKSEPSREEGKLGIEHDSEDRGTALGCYGSEAEEEKFGYYEEPPSRKNQQPQRK